MATKMMSIKEIETRKATLNSEIDFLTELYRIGGEYNHAVPTLALVGEFEKMGRVRRTELEMLTKALNDFMNTVQVVVEV